MVLRSKRRQASAPPQPINVTDLPDVLLQKIVLLAVNPIKTRWGVPLESFSDLVKTIDSIIKSCKALRGAVNVNVWFRAFDLAMPRIESAWELLPHEKLAYRAWRLNLRRWRAAMGYAWPTWSAPHFNVRRASPDRAPSPDR